MKGHNMKSKILILLVLFSLSVFAGKCPQCGFDNTDEDRYCLECGAELRALSNEEKEKYDEINNNKTERAIEILKEKKENEKVPKRAPNRRSVNIDYRAEVAKVFLTNIHVFVTATNNSRVPIKTLSVSIKANYSNSWSAITIADLVVSYESPLQPGASITKEINLFGTGVTLGTHLKNYIEVQVSTASWS